MVQLEGQLELSKFLKTFSFWLSEDAAVIGNLRGKLEVYEKLTSTGQLTTAIKHEHGCPPVKQQRMSHQMNPRHWTANFIWKLKNE